MGKCLLMGDEVGKSGRKCRGNNSLQDEVAGLSCLPEPVSACGADCGVYFPPLGGISQYLILINSIMKNCKDCKINA